MDVFDYENDEKIRDEYITVSEHNYQGVEAEAGLMYRINGFLITAGVTTVNFEYANITAGIGYSLPFR